MGETTAIAWTNKTWNPWQGCHKVSAGCTNCYMHREKRRFGQAPGTVVRSKPATFRAPLKWKEPALVFTCSWSDFFIEEADAWRPEVWEIIRATPHLTYQILTKRPERIADHLPANWGEGWGNCWLGVTVEDSDALWRVELLRKVPATLRFISCEPLIAPIYIPYGYLMDDRALGLVIVGGESGPGARPCDLAWIRSLVEQCKAAGTKCFVKQVGPNPYERRETPSGEGWDPSDLLAGNARDDEAYRKWFKEWTLVKTSEGSAFYRYLKLRDRKGGDMSEWPSDLRIREMPTTRRTP